MSPLVPHHPVPSTPSLWERLGWGPTRVQGRCHPMGQTQQQDPHPHHHLPRFTWMVLAMQVRMVHVWAMQAGMVRWMMQVDDAGGRCVCRQCRQGCGQAGTSRWLPWVGDGLLLPGKAPETATPHAQRAAFQKDLQTSVLLSRRSARRCLCLRFTGWDLARPLLCFSLGLWLIFFSLYEERLKGEQKVCTPERCAGDRS